MPKEFPFHTLFTLFAFVMVWNRAYYYGYAHASGEGISRTAEGFVLRRIRAVLGSLFLAGCLLYILNPDWVEWSRLVKFPYVLRWLGLFFLAGAAVLYRWTHKSLDKNFTDTVFIRKGAFLVQSGPYRWVRHPMYLSALMIALGTGLTLDNLLLGVFGISLILVIMFYRTPLEEQKLMERHGKAYRDYIKNTGRFIPKWRRPTP